jgi:hypothetical protein
LEAEDETAAGAIDAEDVAVSGGENREARADGKVERR